MSDGEESVNAAPDEKESNATDARAGSVRSSKPPTRKSDRFYEAWDKFISLPPAPTRSVIRSLEIDIENHPGHHPGKNKKGVTSSENAVVSYAEAVETCKSKVKAIVDECRRLNKKYFDPLFMLPLPDTLMGLGTDEIPDSYQDDIGVASVQRVEDIFDNPQFMIDGATANDVRQGRTGDCWFLAAVTALSGTEENDKGNGLISRVCVAQDTKAGVYGFVFHRDGEWISEVIDDRLCVRYQGDHQQFLCSIPYDKKIGDVELGRHNFERIPNNIKDNLNCGSNTLYFASCHDSDETWLPLLEKAYAKAHGDYQAIDAGFAGEGIEDLTGGVNTSISSEEILDRDILWQELLRVNKDFLFGCSSRRGVDEKPADLEGFVRGHAYTVLAAKEVILHDFRKEKLLKIRNPWGHQEWNGSWSDGSKEWTADTLRQLNHSFGDDGVFWISFKDFLKYYPRIDRTRLFGPEWVVTQQWTSVAVPFRIDYLPTVFRLTVEREGPIVIVLSQPDSRYFNGLEGRYEFTLHYRVYRDGEPTYLIRSMGDSGSNRSCSAELEVTPGKYTVIMKITTWRDDDAKTPEDTIRTFRRSRTDKLLAIGTSYDMIHSKGLRREKEAEEFLKRTEEVVKREKDKAVAVMKIDRAYNRESRRKVKLRYERRKRELELKRAAKKAAKAAEKFAAATAVAAAAAMVATEQAVTGDAEDAKADDETQENKAGDPSNEKDDEEDWEDEDDEADEEPAEATEKEATPIASANGMAYPLINGHPETDDDDVSDVQDDDLEWDSDIDDPVTRPVYPPPDAADDEMFPDDPWNAVCVVGLRVYSLHQGVKVETIDA